MKVNNHIYNSLGERWYTAYDDPVALLRAESELRNPWVLEKIAGQFRDSSIRILDVGCGAGFLSNALAKKYDSVIGVDLSEESLSVAHAYDSTKKARYMNANALSLPFDDGSFEVACAMDFLEHVEDPNAVIREISRVLKPGGIFFFHTFNRNWISKLVAIHCVEWFIKNTPEHLHVYSYFIKPSELSAYCKNSGLHPQEWRGVKPSLFSLHTLKTLFTGVLSKQFSFSFSRSLLVGYCGVAVKDCSSASGAPEVVLKKLRKNYT